MRGFIVERQYQLDTARQVEALIRVLEDVLEQAPGTTRPERDGVSMAVGGAIVSGNEAKAELPQQHRDPHDQASLAIRPDLERGALPKAQEREAQPQEAT